MIKDNEKTPDISDDQSVSSLDMVEEFISHIENPKHCLGFLGKQFPQHC